MATVVAELEVCEDCYFEVAEFGAISVASFRRKGTLMPGEQVSVFSKTGCQCCKAKNPRTGAMLAGPRFTIHLMRG